MVQMNYTVSVEEKTVLLQHKIPEPPADARGDSDRTAMHSVEGHANNQATDGANRKPRSMTRAMGEGTVRDKPCEYGESDNPTKIPNLPLARVRVFG